MVFRAALHDGDARGRAALHVMVPPAGDPKGNGQTTKFGPQDQVYVLHLSNNKINIKKHIYT